MRRKGFRCFQTSRRSLHSCRSQAHCASCRAFLLPRSCEGKSATCAAPETVYPTHRCWGWSSAWLRACPCCRGGDTQNTCIEQAHRYGENMRSVSLKLFFSLSIHASFHSHAFLSHAIAGINKLKHPRSLQHHATPPALPNIQKFVIHPLMHQNLHPHPSQPFTHRTNRNQLLPTVMQLHLIDIMHTYLFC